MTIYATKVRKIDDLDANRAVFLIQGISGTAYASSTTTIDWKFPEERWLSGGRLLVSGGTWGDTIDIQLVDKDNTLGGGANLVLNEHVTDYRVNPSSTDQGEYHSPYIALVPANTYLRIKYTNTSLLSTARVALNLFTHVPKV